MATPSLLAATSIVPLANGIAVGATSTAILNPTSGHGYLIKYLAFTNKDTVARTITCNLHSAASGGGTAFAMCYQISIPANYTYVVIGNGSEMDISDDRSIYAIAGTASTIECAISGKDYS